MDKSITDLRWIDGGKGRQQPEMRNPRVEVLVGEPSGVWSVHK